MARNRVTFDNELILREGKVGIGTSVPTSNLNVVGDVELRGPLKVTSTGSASTEHIEIKHYTNEGGTIAYELGDEHLFSVSKNSDQFLYVVSNNDGVPALSISTSSNASIANNLTVGAGATIGAGLTVGLSLGVGNSVGVGSYVQTPAVNFISSGAAKTTEISAKHYSNNNGSLVFQSPDRQLFSIDNLQDGINYAINDSEGRSALTVNDSGITTIRDLFQNRVNFTSIGSTESENIQLNHYRNIAYQPAVGSTIDNRGAISFDSPLGISTDGVTFFPASLFALTNGGGNIFSVGGYQYFSGSSVPVLDITQDGKIGIGTTSPLHDVHIISKNIVAPGSNLTLNSVLSSEIISSGIITTPNVRINKEISFSDQLNSEQNTFIKLESRSTGVSTSSLSGGAVLFSGNNLTPFNSGQLVTIENNVNNYFRVNVNTLTPISVAGIAQTFLPAGQAAVIPAFDINKYGEVKIYDTITKPGDTFNPLAVGIATLAPNDADLFRIDSYSTPFIGSFPTINQALKVSKFGNVEIFRNVNQISGVSTVGVATTSTSLTVNATLTFELLNNNTLTIKVRGTDGVTRSGIVTLS